MSNENAPETIIHCAAAYERWRKATIHHAMVNGVEYVRKDVVAHDIAKLLAVLADVKAAWLYEANQGDGIMEEHADILARADAALAGGNDE
jgi:hypothetical protein